MVVVKRRAAHLAARTKSPDRRPCPSGRAKSAERVRPSVAVLYRSSYMANISLCPYAPAVLAELRAEVQAARTRCFPCSSCPRKSIHAAHRMSRACNIFPSTCTSATPPPRAPSPSPTAPPPSPPTHSPYYTPQNTHSPYRPWRTPPTVPIPPREHPKVELASGASCFALR